MNRNVCVVGGGNWGKKHINSLNKFGVLSGIVDSSSQIIDELKAQYPKVSFFQNIDDALENDFDGKDHQMILMVHLEIHLMLHHLVYELIMLHINLHD